MVVFSSIFPVTRVGTGGLPILGIASDYFGMMCRWTVVEIQGNRRRGKQHAGGYSARGRTRHPRQAVLIIVMVRIVAVIHLVTRVIDILVLLDEDRARFDIDVDRKSVV